jgi:hypothetical protein
MSGPSTNPGQQPVRFALAVMQRVRKVPLSASLRAVCNGVAAFQNVHPASLLKRRSSKGRRSTAGTQASAIRMERFNQDIDDVRNGGVRHDQDRPSHGR